MTTGFRELTAMAAADPKAFRDFDRQACFEAARRYAHGQRASIRARHEAGESGANVARQLAELADSVLRGVFKFGLATLATHRTLASRTALCALGGYGRAELNPHSDLDVCLVYEGALDKEIEALNGYLIPFCWDLGFKVGYAIRTIHEARELIKTDKRAFTSFWQSRLLAGDTTVFAQLKLMARDLQASSLTRKFMHEVVHERFDGLSPQHADLYCAEPNVKENAGGLRDYHSALWLFMTAYSANNLDDAASVGIVEQEELLAILEALDFLLRIRNELHFRAGANDDVLSFRNQQHVARAFGYAAGEQHNISRLMEDYYAASAQVRNLLRLAARVWDYQAPAPTAVFPGEGQEEPSVHNGELHAGHHDPNWFAQNPARLMEVFWKCAIHDAGLSYNTERLVRKNLRFAEDAFRSSDLVRRLFLAICNQPLQAGRVLRHMAETGLLGKYLPEFAAIEGTIRYEDFHSFPVHEHTLRAVEALAGLNDKTDPVSRCLRAALEHLPDPYVLVLAILFHDLGKAAGDVHVEESVRLTRRIGERMGMLGDDIERVVFLVEHHMLMTFISQYRDVDDEEIVSSFADAMKTEERLRALFLLSYADLYAVGPGVWNDWKGALLMKLYLESEKRLLGRTESPSASCCDSPKGKEVRDRVADTAREDVASHLEGLGERYFVAFSAAEMARHVELAARARETGLAVGYHPVDGTPMCEVVICAQDQRGLFAKLAGSFASQLIDVNGAALFTHADGLALDCFTVSEAVGQRPITQTEIAGLERVLRSVLVDGNDVESYVEQARRRIFALLQPRIPVRTRIQFDNHSSRHHTVIDIETGDRTGLLYDIAVAMTEAGLDIASARIVTDARRVRDSFYVSLDGRKLEASGQQDDVRMHIHNAIHPRPSVERKGVAS